MSLSQGSNARSLAVSFGLRQSHFFDNDASSSNIFCFDHFFIFVAFAAFTLIWLLTLLCIWPIPKIQNFWPNKL